MFIVIVSVIQFFCMLAVALGSIMTYGTLSNKTFLGPVQMYIKPLNKLPYEIKNHFEIYRLVTPIFLHVGLSHFMFNFISQIIFGTLLEQMIGFRQMACLYMATGVGGNLFSSLISDNPSVGASTAVFGVLAG